MLTFFAPKQNEKFATVINGDNIYSWAEGYGTVMAHRNIGMVFPSTEAAEIKVALMKHIMFCTDLYWFPAQWTRCDKFDAKNYNWYEEIEFDIDKHLFEYSVWLIIIQNKKEFEYRRNLLSGNLEILKQSLREYKSAELENILNSY